MSKQVSPETVEILFEDLRTMQGSMTNLREQMQRLHRMFKTDEVEARNAETQANALFIHTVNKNTQALNNLVDTQLREQEVTKGFDLYQRTKALEKRKRKNQRLAHTRYLKTLQQRVTPECSCGKHKGVIFVNPETGEQVDSLCPMHWWLKLARLAHEDGEAERFLKNNPVDKFLIRFRLK